MYISEQIWFNYVIMHVMFFFFLQNHIIVTTHIDRRSVAAATQSKIIVKMYERKLLC
jgi:hypothetical protein